MLMTDAIVPAAGPARNVLLIVGGGIAAYKACELVRLLRREGTGVTCVLTESGARFVTAMTLAALSENPVHTTLWDLKNEVEMGHIQLSRAADLVVVCPATADLMARMAAGIADDLATTLLLATDKPVLTVPAMNVRMWLHPATERNVAQLRGDGIAVMEPDEGEMACGEYGPGRLPDPAEIAAAIGEMLGGRGVDFGGETLGGLSGGMIARAPERVETVLDDIDYFAGSEDPGALFVEEEVPEQLTTEELAAQERADEEPAAPLDLGGPLLSKKGKAKSAPPTDPEAINHIVKSDPEAAPEPFVENPAEAEEAAAVPPGEPAAPEPSAPEPSAPEPSAPGPATTEPAATLAEPAPDILAGQPDFAGTDPANLPLYGKRIIVTAGPTHEPIDPVRYIANRSSGKQGFAIAAAAQRAGARVILVSGPVALPTPPGVERLYIETARDMAKAVEASLPADCAIMVAAVADWRTTEVSQGKMKKRRSAPPHLVLTENPDILTGLAAGGRKPRLLIGFAAETDDVIANAKGKLKSKGADWIVANDVSGGTGKSVMGGDDNTVHLVTSAGVETWASMPKDEVAERLVRRIAEKLAEDV